MWFFRPLGQRLHKLGPTYVLALGPLYHLIVVVMIIIVIMAMAMVRAIVDRFR